MEAESALRTYVDAQHRLGQRIPLSAISAVIHQPGIEEVELTSPTENIEVAVDKAAFCTNIMLTLA